MSIFDTIFWMRGKKTKSAAQAVVKHTQIFLNMYFFKTYFCIFKFKLKRKMIATEHQIKF